MKHTTLPETAHIGTVSAGDSSVSVSLRFSFPLVSGEMQTLCLERNRKRPQADLDNGVSTPSRQPLQMFYKAASSTETDDVLRTDSGNKNVFVARHPWTLLLFLENLLKHVLPCVLCVCACFCRLKPFTSYKLRMLATNDVGDSVLSKETEAATTLQDGKRLDAERGRR